MIFYINWNMFNALLVNIFLNLYLNCKASNVHLKEQIASTGLLRDKAEELLLISTVDGSLYAVAKRTGKIQWSLKDDPIIINPLSRSSESDEPIPQFFPNPQDGSLYRYTFGRGREPLKKLPFTIPQLVTNSPCRSNDGVFYLGKKTDTWVGIDRLTGEKEFIMNMEHIDKRCPRSSKHTVYLGRTLYNIILYDPGSGHKWNISFYDYSTNSAALLEHYDLAHFTSSGQGSVLTVEQGTGSLLWTLDLDSPLVAMYLLAGEGHLQTLPLTIVSPQTLEHFTKEFMHSTSYNFDTESLLVQKLSPTVYLGETKSGIYVVPTLVDEMTAVIRKQSQLLLTGPSNYQTTEPPDKNKYSTDEISDVLVLGYYELPEHLNSDLTRLPDSSDFAVIPPGITYLPNDTYEINNVYSVKLNEAWNGVLQIKSGNLSFIGSFDLLLWGRTILTLSIMWTVSNLLSVFLFLLLIMLLAIILLLYFQGKWYVQLKQELSSHKQWSRGSSSSYSSDITSQTEETDDGYIKIGKIKFQPDSILGKGGTFDDRPVAVKRVLPDCFSIASREVELLRQSDQHPNCRQFRYIALELCAATLEDFVVGKFVVDIDSILILQEATCGLKHLHDLGIVHRDIKSQNVLLRLSPVNQEVHALISDFGLCKRLETGRVSFSKRSGVTGTEGWIAPEMLLESGRPGIHPFGSILDRQSNILAGKFTIQLPGQIKDSWKLLLEKMLSSLSSQRPSVAAVLKHPVFWDNERILSFFQDVSDHIETEDFGSIIILNLERGAAEIVRDDWKLHMHRAIADDLRKFRDYHGKSVRDLLRALRNKKNHYRELTDEVRNVFGALPNEFVHYWTSRFPKLLIHTWLAFHCCKSEPAFEKYYDTSYNFIQQQEEEGDRLVVEFLNGPLPVLGPNGNVKSKVHKKWSYSPKLTKEKFKQEKHEDIKDSHVPWIITKPQRTFEPQFGSFLKTESGKPHDEFANNLISEIQEIENSENYQNSTCTLQISASQAFANNAGMISLKSKAYRNRKNRRWETQSTEAYKKNLPE